PIAVLVRDELRIVKVIPLFRALPFIELPDELSGRAVDGFQLRRSSTDDDIHNAVIIKIFERRRAEYLVDGSHPPKHPAITAIKRDDRGIARVEFFTTRPQDHVANSIAIQVGNPR